MNIGSSFYSLDQVAGAEVQKSEVDCRLIAPVQFHSMRVLAASVCAIISTEKT